MNKLALSCLSLLTCLPMIGFASPCSPYNENYSLTANGATGTLAKVQTMNGNQYSITSTINVSKLFMSKTIVQTATGTCDANGNIVAQNFSNSNADSPNPVALSSQQLDTLSLVLFLSNQLNMKAPTFPIIPLFYNGTVVSVQCAITNANATLVSNSGQSMPAINIACVTPEQPTPAVELGYSFDPNSPSHTMLAAYVIDNGTKTMSALID